MARKRKKGGKRRYRRLSPAHRKAIARGLRRYHRGGKRRGEGRKQTRARGGKKRGRRYGRGRARAQRCSIDGRTIFGGAKGMATHMRRRHRGRRK